MINQILIIVFIIELSFSLDQSQPLNCSNHGIFNEELAQCICSEGYTTFPIDSSVKCNYELREYSIAKFLSLFGGFVGADRFYLGHSVKGIIKCALPVILLVLTLHHYDRVKHLYYSKYVLIFPFIMWVILWLFDVTMILSGNTKDANGITLHYE